MLPNTDVELRRCLDLLFTLLRLGETGMDAAVGKCTRRFDSTADREGDRAFTNPLPLETDENRSFSCTSTSRSSSSLLPPPDSFSRP